MKPLPILLVLSLVANAALYFTLPSSADRAAEKSTTTSPTSASAAEKSRAPAPEPHAALWEKLRTGDTSAIEQLRAAGWPESAIKALVEAQVDELFRPRQKALRHDPSDYQYWNEFALRKQWGPKERQASRDLALEKRAMLKKLLGADYVSTSDASYDWELGRYSSYTPAKAEALRLLEGDYSAMVQDLRGNNYGPSIWLPEDREKLALIEKARREDLAKILSPAELEEFDLKYSSTSSQLRYSLTAFEATEEEFKMIYALQKPYDEKAGPQYGQSTRAQQEAAQQAREEIKAKLKGMLGEVRYADYLRSQDYQYRTLYTIADRLSLPKESAATAYQVSQGVKDQINKLPKPKTPDDITTYNASLQTLRQDTENRLIAALGQEGYEVYKLNGGSDLLSRLAPRPLPSATPKQP